MERRKSIHNTWCWKLSKETFFLISSSFSDFFFKVEDFARINLIFFSIPISIQKIQATQGSLWKFILSRCSKVSTPSPIHRSQLNFKVQPYPGGIFNRLMRSRSCQKSLYQLTYKKHADNLYRDSKSGVCDISREKGCCSKVPHRRSGDWRSLEESRKSSTHFVLIRIREGAKFISLHLGQWGGGTKSFWDEKNDYKMGA